MSSRSLVGWMCACGLAALAAPAAAQDCQDDADCGPGFVCESFGTTECGFACPEGEKCPDMPPDCEPMEVKGCSPAPCMNDDECPADMVCFAQTYTECSGGSERPAADPGAAGAGGAADAGSAEPAPAPVEPECKEVTESYCAPKYVPPCTEDADCGAGFTCEEQESCSCSGSAGSAGGAAGTGGGEAPPEPTEPDCSCEKTGEFYCKLVETACESADECPDGFTCDANPESAVCSPPVMTEPAGTGGADGSADGGAAEGGGAPDPDAPAPDSCGATTEPEKVCLPPYWDKGFGGGGRGFDALGEDGASATGSGGPGMGAPEPASDPTAAGNDDGAEADASGGDSGDCSVAIVGDARSRERAGFASLGTALALLALAWRRRRAA